MARVRFEVEDECLTAGTFPWVKREHLERFKFAARFMREKVVLDCACGKGIGSAEFVKTAPGYIVAVDRSLTSLHDAGSLAAGDRFAAVAGDALRLPFFGGSFDVVVSLETLEHLADRQAFLSEVHRVLRADGLFICSTPNRSVTHPGAPGSVAPMNRYHACEYSIEEFKALVAQYFCNLEMYGQNPQRKIQARLFSLLTLAIPYRVVARLNQALKTTRYLRYSSEAAVVTPLRHDRDYEYALICCRKAV